MNSKIRTSVLLACICVLAVAVFATRYQGYQEEKTKEKIYDKTHIPPATIQAAVAALAKQEHDDDKKIASMHLSDAEKKRLNSEAVDNEMRSFYADMYKRTGGKVNVTLKTQ